MSLPDLSLRQVLELAVSTEELGAKYYEDLAERFAAEPEVAEVFRRLGKDELAHEASFRRLLETADPARSFQPDDDGYFVLRAAASSEFFDPKKLGSPSAIETPAAALAFGLGFEKSTLFFYQSVKEALGGSPELDALIAAEREHVSALMKTIISDAKFRGLSDHW